MAKPHPILRPHLFNILPFIKLLRSIYIEKPWGDDTTDLKVVTVTPLKIPVILTVEETKAYSKFIWDHLLFGKYLVGFKNLAAKLKKSGRPYKTPIKDAVSEILSPVGAIFNLPLILLSTASSLGLMTLVLGVLGGIVFPYIAISQITRLQRITPTPLRILAKLGLGLAAMATGLILAGVVTSIIAISAALPIGIALPAHAAHLISSVLDLATAPIRAMSRSIATAIHGKRTFEDVASKDIQKANEILNKAEELTTEDKFQLFKVIEHLNHLVNKMGSRKVTFRKRDSASTYARLQELYKNHFEAKSEKLDAGYSRRMHDAFNTQCIESNVRRLLTSTDDNPGVVEQRRINVRNAAIKAQKSTLPDGSISGADSDLPPINTQPAEPDTDLIQNQGFFARLDIEKYLETIQGSSKKDVLGRRTTVVAGELDYTRM